MAFTPPIPQTVVPRRRRTNAPGVAGPAIDAAIDASQSQAEMEPPPPEPPLPPESQIPGTTDFFYNQNRPEKFGVSDVDFLNTTIGATQGGPTGRGGIGSVDHEFARYRNYLAEGGDPNATGMVNAARYQFNQDPFWAQNYGQRMDYLAAASAGRQAPQFDPNMAGYNMAALQGQQARNAGFGAVDALSGAVDQFGNQLPQFEQDVQGIRDVAMGRGGPSAAELAMQRSSDQAFRQNLATAATGARGGAMGSAFLNAGLQNSIDQGALTRDLGVQRAQEQAIARGQLLQGQQNLTGAYDQFTQGRGMVVDAFGNIRGSDIDTAGVAGDLAMRGEEGRVGTQLDQTRLNDDMVKFFTSQGYSAQEAQLRANMAMDQARTGNYLDELAIKTGAPRPEKSDPFKDYVLPGMQAGGATLATLALLLSDVRSKRDMEPADAETEAFLRRLGDAEGSAMSFEDRMTALASPEAPPDFRPTSATSYRYKDPSQPGADNRTHVGPMAQELERDPVGATVVTDGPNGKAIDTGRLTLLNTSGIGQQQRRLDEIERRQLEMMQGIPAMPAGVMPSLAPVPYYGDPYAVASDIENKTDMADASGAVSDFWQRLGAAGQTMANLDPTIALGYQREQEKRRPARTPKEEDEEETGPFSGVTLPPSPGLSVAGRSPMATTIAARPRPIGPLNPTPMPGQPRLGAPGMAF